MRLRTTAILATATAAATSILLLAGCGDSASEATISTTTSTNAASPESASPVPMPVMSQELMKRYGLLPRMTTNRAAPTPGKVSTPSPTNPAPGQ